MPKEEYFNVSVYLEQIAKVKVKGTSQRNAEEKLRQFCEKFTDLLDEEKKIVPNLPFEIEEIENYFVDIIDIGLYPTLTTTEKIQPTYNTILKGEESDLQKLMQNHSEVTESVIREIQKEKNSKKDLTNPENFVNLKTESRKVKFKE